MVHYCPGICQQVLWVWVAADGKMLNNSSLQTDYTNDMMMWMLVCDVLPDQPLHVFHQNPCPSISHTGRCGMNIRKEETIGRVTGPAYVLKYHRTSQRKKWQPHLWFKGRIDQNPWGQGVI